MNAQELAEAYYSANNQRYQFMVDNAFIKGLEADLICVKKTGYTDEVEIKVSRSDFLADFKKKVVIHSYDPLLPPMQRASSKEWLKHDRIKDGLGNANSFIFLMPLELAEQCLKDVPDGYGLIGFDGRRLRDMKKAKKFHRNKITNDMKEVLLMKCFYRYWDIRVNSLAVGKQLASQKKKIKALEEHFKIEDE